MREHLPLLPQAAPFISCFHDPSLSDSRFLHVAEAGRWLMFGVGEVAANNAELIQKGIFCESLHFQPLLFSSLKSSVFLSFSHQLLRVKTQLFWVFVHL